MIDSKISHWWGDVTKSNIDCIVNAGTENLEGGGGIVGAIDLLIKHLGQSYWMHVKNFPLITNQILVAKLANVK